MTEALRAMIAQFDAVPGVSCLCGVARHAFCEGDNVLATWHLADIAEDAQTDDYKQMTEIYVIFEGEDETELDDKGVPVGPLTSVSLKPGCRHRAIERMRILNIPILVFDEDDEWFD